jgi:hypothetical protein
MRAISEAIEVSMSADSIVQAWRDAIRVARKVR